MFFLHSGIAVFAQENIVNVYSHRHYDVDTQIYKEFEFKTGIKVNVIGGGAGELVERAIIERANTQADVFFMVGVGSLARLSANNVLQPLPVSIANRVDSNLRAPNNLWLAVSKRARVIVYDKTKISNPTISTYQELVESGKRIAVRSSHNSYNKALLASIILNEGEAAARQWVRNLVKNLARPPQGNDRAQAKAVVSGLADYAIMNTYYVGLMLRSADANERAIAKKLAIIFPNQNGTGTHVNVSGVGISKYAKHKDNAILLISFLLSDDIQKKIVLANYEYPAVSNIEPVALVKQWGSFKEDIATNLNELGLLIPLATRIADEEGWK